MRAALAGGISKFGNEKIWKLANEMEATRNAPAKRINFAKGASRIGKNFGKVYTAKVTYLSYRKETEKNGRGLRGILMKKGYEKGGGSL